MTTARDFARGVNPDYVDVTDLMQYEEGQLSDEATVGLFQRLINNGMAWSLQGHYGRTAMSLIRAGLCHAKANVKSNNNASQDNDNLRSASDNLGGGC